jgi:ankyrin repeat protein
MKTFISRLLRTKYSRVAALLLIVLIWNLPVFCEEIHDAAMHGDLAKVKALLQDKPELVFVKDWLGFTPLHSAAQEGYLEMAKALLVLRG